MKYSNNALLAAAIAATSSQALANGLQQWEKASAFLSFIKKRCVNHPAHEHIDVWLEQAANQQPLKGPKASFQVSD